ncbi:tryptophan synthase subunit alpha [Bacillus horti]|uniref:Tryptophan synthase alpha chain n=1 Tax=Caldalkalibacillus horti TaxID=77523 RepID=A0ABT9VWY6_9BACI|nr:tryptophan synthase subunit alpha [Bacillus horti]MDQ0165479.1 tryptophan synthase alpha chain [Bacillus horti]
MSVIHHSSVQSIELAISAKNERGKPAFIPFIVGGYPSIDRTIDIALTLQDAGADILELGIPYSDPLADGPIIQQASKEALEEGMSLSAGIKLIKQLKAAGVHIPILPFCYYNPILQYGLDRFVKATKEAGASGVLVPDLPFEEAGELRKVCQEHSFACISLVAPTSERRIQHILQEASGFIYCISSLGVTGIRDQFAEEIEGFLSVVKASAKVPVAVGFGVSRKEQVQYLKKFVDGIVIGSAIVKLVIEQKQQLLNDQTKQKALEVIKRFVQECFSE